MAVKNDISLQTFVAAKENGFACSDRCGTDFPRLILIFAAAKENGSACYGRNGSDLPRPILFFVAAKENGFACSGRRDNDVRVRFYSPRTALRHNRAGLPGMTPESPWGCCPGVSISKPSS